MSVELKDEVVDLGLLGVAVLTFDANPQPDFQEICPDCDKAMWWDCSEPGWYCCKGWRSPEEGEHMVRLGVWMPNPPKND